MAKSKSVKLFVVTLLNNKNILIKNTSGKLVSDMKERNYIKNYVLYRECDRKSPLLDRVTFDFDRMRSLKSTHNSLVTNLYLNTEG